MSDDEAAGAETAARLQLLGLYRRTKNKAFLRAARCLRNDGRRLDVRDVLLEFAAVERTGRPAEKDDDALLEMALMLTRGEADDVTAAARVIAARNPGHSQDSTIIRLVRKHREAPPDPELVGLVLELERDVRQRHEDVARLLRGLRELEQQAEGASQHRRELEQQAEDVSLILRGIEQRRRTTSSPADDDEQNSEV